MINPNPSVTALCLTKSRREWLPKAIADFQAQTYVNKQILILADTTGDVDGLVPLDDPTIQVELLSYLHKPCPTIGSKRNFGCSLISTDLIAHWDDDDHYGPRHLFEQVRLLVDTGKSVTGYHSVKFTDGTKWWKYLGTPQFALGASLMYRREWWESHHFPSLQIGEDNAFVTTAWSNGQLIPTDAAADLEPRRTTGDRMIVNIHAGNTSKKVPHDNWRPLL